MSCFGMGFNAAGDARNFGTALYTGNETARAINVLTNLALTGGLVWLRERGNGGTSGQHHVIKDSVRGASAELQPNRAEPETATTTNVTAFTQQGFNLDDDPTYNGSGIGYVAWCFRKKAKFLDIVTYAGDNTTARAIPHSLGSAPGMIIVKSRDSNDTWAVYHKELNNGSNPEAYSLELESSSGVVSHLPLRFGPVAPTSTDFYVGTNSLNASGEDYVAYAFAHNPAERIMCGEATNGVPVVLGFAPRFLLLKSTGSGPWYLLDSTRGFPVGNDVVLQIDTTVEDPAQDIADRLSDGFVVNAGAGTYVYLAVG